MPPAARVTDPHVCPAFTGPVPHVGGPILPPGCPTVLIDFLPAARMTDMVTCVGPPSTILKGSTGVFIGGLPAARLGDPTAHGGAIVFGAPNVIIGEIGSGAPGLGGFNAVVAGLVASIPADQDSSWLSRFGHGLFDSTLAPLGHMIAHPIQTAEGIGHAIAHPVQTAQAAGHAIKETAKGVAAGDARAIGMAVGTIGMMAIPGAGEAEGAEDAARIGKIGEVGEEAGAASKLSKLASVDPRKFSDYIFKEGATHGKNAVFEGLGYTKADTQTLVDLYEQQGAQKFAANDFTLGKLDQFGQRINIEIALPGQGNATGTTSFLKSGWMQNPDGTISLNTPFTGFTR